MNFINYQFSNINYQLSIDEFCPPLKYEARGYKPFSVKNSLSRVLHKVLIVIVCNQFFFCWLNFSLRFKRVFIEV